MKNRTKEVVKKLMKARALVLEADVMLCQVSDYVIGAEKICEIIDKNLKYFPKYVKEIDASFYDFLLKKD